MVCWLIQREGERGGPQKPKSLTHLLKAKCTAIQTLRGYYTEGIDEDEYQAAIDKENQEPSNADGLYEDECEDEHQDEELIYLGIKEHLAVLDYNNYFVNTGASFLSLPFFFSLLVQMCV